VLVFDVDPVGEVVLFGICVAAGVSSSL
jgi:hypothetical protein